MVRRRSTVRFRKGAHEPKHEKRHPIELSAFGVAFSLFRLATRLGAVSYGSLYRSSGAHGRAPRTPYGTPASSSTDRSREILNLVGLDPGASEVIRLASGRDGRWRDNACHCS